MKLVLAGCMAAALALGASSAFGATVFSDTFDSEGTPGATDLNYAGFTQWSVGGGTVDLVLSGDFGITCPGAAGKCVDLDGSTSDAGVMASSGISFVPGTYILTFDYTGNQRGGADDSFTVAITGGLYFASFPVVPSGQGLTPFSSGPIVVGSGSVQSIVFSAAGGDNIGPILDNVVLELVDVPEPSTWALMIVGFWLLALGRRRQSVRL